MLIRRLDTGALVIAMILMALPTVASAAPPKVSADTPVTANDLRSPRAQNSPQLAADPTDRRFVVAATRLDGPDLGCDLELSGDAGRSWVPAQPVPKLPSGAEKCYAPELAFDLDGRLYYLFVGLHGRGNEPMGAFLTRSDDRGRSFDKPRRLLGGQNYMVRMAIDPTMGDSGRIHLVWLQTAEAPGLGGLPPGPNPIRAAFSDDGGATFSQPIQINDRERPMAVAPALTIGRNHAVHVLYYDLREDRLDYQGLTGPTWSGPWSIISTTSYDGGRHFRRGAVVNDRLKPPERVMLIFTMPPPTIAADSSGKVFAAWHDARNGDWDVFLSRSTDKGRSWARPLRLNDDRKRNGRNQYLPRLATAPNGRVDAIFLDRRNDPKNLRNETFYAFSSDGGARFSSNVKLSSEPSDSRRGQRYLVPSAKGLVEFGGRLGLLSRNDGAVAAWTDTRLASATAYQDIFSAEIAFSRTPRPAKGAAPGNGASTERPALLLPLAAIGLGAACAAGLAMRRRRRDCLAWADAA